MTMCKWSNEGDESGGDKGIKWAPLLLKSFKKRLCVGCVDSSCEVKI